MLRLCHSRTPIRLLHSSASLRQTNFANFKVKATVDDLFSDPGVKEQQGNRFAMKYQVGDKGTGKNQTGNRTANQTASQTANRTANRTANQTANKGSNSNARFNGNTSDADGQNSKNSAKYGKDAQRSQNGQSYPTNQSTQTNQTNAKHQNRAHAFSKDTSNRYRNSYGNNSYGNNSSGNNAYGNNKISKAKTSPRKPAFEFTTGSVQAQTALKDLILQTKEYSPKFNVKYVNPETGKLETTQLVDVCNSLDLSKVGLLLIPNGSDETPMVKQVKVEDMITKFTDKLALQKEKELLDKGSRTAQKVINQRMKLEKKKSALKVLNILWKINQADLNNQKKFEIQRRLEKGEKFTIFLKSKGRETEEVEEVAEGEVEPTSNNILHSKLDEHELSIELQRRDMVYNTLVSILDELPCTYKVEGKLETRLSIAMTPKEESKVEEIPKENKKVKKAQKQPKAKSKTDVEDLDTLYSMKIED